MAKTLGSLNVGDKIKLGKIYNNKIIWKITDKNHQGYPDNSVSLITERLIKMLCFDAMEPENSDNNRKIGGNNRYLHSNLLQWLNKSTNPWFVKQHAADEPPTTDKCHVISDDNSYDNVPGFLAQWTTDEKTLLLDTTVIVNKASIDGGGQENVTSKIFLLSWKELNIDMAVKSEGVKHALFSDNVSRRTCITNDVAAVELLPVDYEYGYLIRSPIIMESNMVYNIVWGNIQDYNNKAAFDSGGLRPSCNLPSSQLISDTTDADGCYTLIFNQPPSTPASITITGTIAVNQKPVITWGESTDPEGTAVKYILERSFNSGAWSAVYNGPNKTFTESAIPAGNTTVKYRVKAYDAEGIESDYITSDLKNITQNTPPAITGSNTNLGTFANQKPAAYNYTVTDAEGGAVTVTEVLDNVTIRTYTPTLGVQQQFAFSDADWLTVLNGTHTIKITAKDPQAAETTRTLTFTKNVTAIEFTAPITPFQADGKPTQALINAVASLPAGCVFQAWICNNGNDASPAWEDCTQSVLTGQKHYFENAAKTADNWGVKVKARLERGSAVGAVSITSITGNFR